MKIKITVSLLLLLFLSSLSVSASSITTSIGNPGSLNAYNNTYQDTAVYTLSPSNKATLIQMVYTDSSTYPANCTPSVIFAHYDGTTWTNESASTLVGGNTSGVVAVTNANVQSVQTFYKQTWEVSNATSVCGLSNFAIEYNAGYSDTVVGLPQLGTDLGNFLQNLAPGVGAFIIIMGIFSGIAAIVYGIIFVIKDRIGKND